MCIIFEGKNVVQQEYMSIMYNILFMHSLSKFFSSVEFVILVRTHGRRMHGFDIKL